MLYLRGSHPEGVTSTLQSKFPKSRNHAHFDRRCLLTVLGTQSLLNKYLFNECSASIKISRSILYRSSVTQRRHLKAERKLLTNPPPFPCSLWDSEVRSPRWAFSWGTAHGYTHRSPPGPSCSTFSPGKPTSGPFRCAGPLPALSL